MHVTFSLPPHLSIIHIMCIAHITQQVLPLTSKAIAHHESRKDLTGWGGQGIAGKIFTHKGPMSWDPRIYKSTQPTHPPCHCPLSSNPSSRIKAGPKCPYFGDNLLIWSRDRITIDNGATNPSPSPTLRDDATHLHAKLTLKTY